MDDDRSSSGTDLDSFDPDVEDYHATSNFMNRRKGDLDGVFTGDVIQACFDGELHEGENDCVVMVGELHECYFGLVLDPEEQLVVDGKVLQINPVQASMSGHWDHRVIKNMQTLAKQHEGKIWNAHKDPRIGNKQRWVPERDHSSTDD